MPPDFCLRLEKPASYLAWHGTSLAGTRTGNSVFVSQFSGHPIALVSGCCWYRRSVADLQLVWSQGLWLWVSCLVSVKREDGTDGNGCFSLVNHEATHAMLPILMLFRRANDHCGCHFRISLSAFSTHGRGEVIGGVAIHQAGYRHHSTPNSARRRLQSNNQGQLGEMARRCRHFP